MIFLLIIIKTNKQILVFLFIETKPSAAVINTHLKQIIKLISSAKNYIK